MITMQDLDEAIAECQGQPHPNANTCIKLAAFLTIKQSMTPQESVGSEQKRDISTYSYSSSVNDAIIAYDSGTEFSEKINGKPINNVLNLMDELMTTLQAMKPRLYSAVLEKL